MPFDTLKQDEKLGERMWKKWSLYSLLIVGLLRIGVALYSTVTHYTPFSQSLVPQNNYRAMPEQYDQEFQKVIQKDIDAITDANGAGSMSELDLYIGLVLAQKEKKYPGFTKRHKQRIEELRQAVVEYVRMYTTLCNQAWSDISPKANKFEIHNCVRASGHQKVKPLLDLLMQTHEESNS